MWESENIDVLVYEGRTFKECDTYVSADLWTEAYQSLWDQASLPGTDPRRFRKRPDRNYRAEWIGEKYTPSNFCRA